MPVLRSSGKPSEKRRHVSPEVSETIRRRQRSRVNFINSNEILTSALHFDQTLRILRDGPKQSDYKSKLFGIIIKFPSCPDCNRHNNVNNYQLSQTPFCHCCTLFFIDQLTDLRNKKSALNSLSVEVLEDSTKPTTVISEADNLVEKVEKWTLEEKIHYGLVEQLSSKNYDERMK